jgi:hypothetical protein
MWTKEDNSRLRKLISEGKNPSEIIEIMGYDKLRENPKKKYVSNYNEFILNEIFAKPKETEFVIGREKSKYFKDKMNYYSTFKTSSGQEYVVDFVYVQEKNQFKNDNVFNLSFTIKENRDLDNYNKYEEETNKKELIELTKRLIYVIIESIDVIKLKYKNVIILIGETENPQKINFYKNVINDSFKNIEEIEDISLYTNGKRAYYYKIF